MLESNNQDIKTILRELVDTYRLKSRITQTKIELAWEKTMGSMISNYTSEIKVRNNKLYVKVDSAPLRQELSYGREKIMRTINRELGEDYLQDVIIR